MSILDTFRGFLQGKWTNRGPPHRYSESPCLNLYSSVSLISRSLAPACFRGSVSSNLGGILGGSKIKKMLISEPIWEVWEHSKSHWTSPLGPLGGCGGLGSLNGAKHSLPGSFSAKSGVKTCKVTDLYKNIGILHFKPRRIRISRWFFHWLTFQGVENQDFQENVSTLDTFRGFS